MSQAQKTSLLAIVALVCSVAVCMPLGVVLGIVALVQINRSRGALGGKGLAIAAIVVGSVLVIPMTGIVAAIAIPNFVRYQLRSKTSEARLTLQTMKMNLMSEAYDKGEFPRGETGWTPETSCGPTKCSLDPSAWGGEVWSRIGGPPVSGPHYYQYSYSSDGQAVRIVASGDLDGDAEPGVFSLEGRIEGGEPVFGEVVDEAVGAY